MKWEEDSTMINCRGYGTTYWFKLGASTVFENKNCDFFLVEV